MLEREVAELRDRVARLEKLVGTLTGTQPQLYYVTTNNVPASHKQMFRMDLLKDMFDHCADMGVVIAYGQRCLRIKLLKVPVEGCHIIAATNCDNSPHILLFRTLEKAAACILTPTQDGVFRWTVDPDLPEWPFT